MDYDDNDFQSQNIHIAGEGSNKFPPVLRPYALPKFEFDESLHGPLRFDSLVETEVFLGIETNEDNQWIEEFSRGGTGIQFGSSTAESCPISRCNNVWSEATSRESVEMLLKSVGQEEIAFVQTNNRDSDACDELGCIIKHMEPSLKEDSNTPCEVGEIRDFHPTLLSGNIPEKISEADGDVREQLPRFVDSSHAQKDDTSIDGGLGDLTAITVGVQPPDLEVSSFIDGKCSNSNQMEGDRTVLDGPMDNIKSSTSGMQDSVLHHIVIGSDELNNDDTAKNVYDTGKDNKSILETDNLPTCEKQHGLGEESQMGDQSLAANVIESGTSHLKSPLGSAPAESTGAESTIEINSKNAAEHSSVMEKGDSGLSEALRTGNQTQLCLHEVSLVGVNANLTLERQKLEDPYGSQSDNANLIGKPGSYLLSVADYDASVKNIDGTNDKNGDNIPLIVERSSAEVLAETHAEDQVASSLPVDSVYSRDKHTDPGQDDSPKCDKVVPDVEKETSEKPYDDSKMEPRVVVPLVADGGPGSNAFSEGGTESELLVSKLPSDFATGNESVSSRDLTATGLVLDKKDGEMSSLPVEVNSGKTSVEASLSDFKTFSQGRSGLDTVSELEKGASSGIAGQMLCKSSDQLLPMVDECVTEDQGSPQAAVINSARQEPTEEMEVNQVISDSDAKRGDVAEALPGENNGKTSPKASEPTVSNDVKDDSWQDRSQNFQKDTITISSDAYDGYIANPATNESGSHADLEKPASGSSTVIGCTELSQTESKEDRVKESTEKIVSVSESIDGDASKVSSVACDPRQSDSLKDERSFTFEVSPLANLPEKIAGEKWQPFPDIQSSKMLLPADASPSVPSLGQLEPQISQDVPRGSSKVSDVAVVSRGSKSNTERKTRRASTKGAAKNSSAKRGGSKETGSGKLERGEKTNNISTGPSGISQLVPSSEMQRYGLVDSGSLKPFVLTASTSSLPDLNSSASPSAVFQQPFTDLQQVQLRAQIFVYGALIQGTAPDEAYMISAFGGLDGGRSSWENAWRSCIERIHGQKSHLITPETPLHSRSGAKAPDQAAKQSAVQSKSISSSVGRASNKGSPTTAVNPLVPLSSPLWTIPTPSGENLQSAGLPRGPVMDYQRALSPLHPHQTPPIRNFVGHSPSWISQAPFCGPWVASPQTSALDASVRFSVQLPITEPVQLTPVKESSVQHASSAKHVSAGSLAHSSVPKHVSPRPVAHSGATANVFTGSPIHSGNKVTASGQPSTEPKPRKRKKSSVSEPPGQGVLPHLMQTESIPALAVTEHIPSSVAITTPVSFVSKAPMEKSVMSVSSSHSTDLRKGDHYGDRRAILSEETLGKVKEARAQAEDASVLAAAAVSHSQEIWKQLDAQRNSGLPPDVETKLASAAVSIAAAAAVAKAAAAAANLASNAAVQAKLMADEAVSFGRYSNNAQSNVNSAFDGAKHLGQVSPASIFKGDDGSNSSSSIILAAREAARRRVEAASAAAKRAENMDAIVKAAELAAEAVSQAGKIVAMGDPLPLNDLVVAGPESYWKVAQVTSALIAKPNDVSRENQIMVNGGEGPDTSARHLKGGPSDRKESDITNHEKLTTIRETSTAEDHVRLTDGFSGSVAANVRDAKGQKNRKASDLAKTIGTIPESERFSQNEPQKVVETSTDNEIKQGSHVEVYKDGAGFRAAWFSADVLSVKDGRAYVSYNELALDGGLEKLKEWVALEGEGEGAPRIRIARPVTAMPFEGTRKRRRAAMGDYHWCIGDKVDAWIKDSWWEGVVTEKSAKDETMLTVQFPVQGETYVVRAWHLRPSLMWKDGEWIEQSSSRENNSSPHEDDTRQEKRPRVRSPPVEIKGKEKTSKGIDVIDPHKPNEPTLLDLSGDEKLFNIGKSTRDQSKSDMVRMTRTGLQKEGSRVAFGIPKPGKKRKFMEVSKHYVADQSNKNNESNDSVKFSKYLMPQGSGSRVLKNTSKTESNERLAALAKPKVLKSGKPPNVSGRTIPQKDNSLSTSASSDGTLTDYIAKTKNSESNVENTSEFQSFPASEGTTGGSIVFSSPALPSDTSSKKMPASNAKTERVSKGKLAPAGGKLGRIEEDKVFSGSSARSTSDAVEPRRSNRRIQPTSRLLEGLQSSLMVSKIPSFSHDKVQRSRNASRGHSHG